MLPSRRFPQFQFFNKGILTLKNQWNLSLDTSISESLSAAMPWEPFDFIKTADHNALKQSAIAEYTRELDPENDLRAIATSQNELCAVLCEKLPWDTEFFGYGIAKLHGIYRLKDGKTYEPFFPLDTAVQKLFEIAKQKSVKYLFTHVDARDLSLLHSLSRNGFHLIETRGYYFRTIQDFECPERFSVREARSDEVDVLSDCAAYMANQYDRFHADPFISIEDSDRLMKEWIKASLLRGLVDKTIVPMSDKPGAFVTIRYHKNKWQSWNTKISQPILSAVDGNFRGWYYKLIGESLYDLKANGSDYVYMTTQITNKAVIRVWEKHGFQYGKGEYIMRKILD